MLLAMAQSSVDSDRLSSAGISTHSSGTAGTVGGSVVGVRPGDAGLKRQDEAEYNLGPLPPMWEKAFTPSGEVYFIDHNTGTSHWLDPRLARVRKHSLGECGEDELPYGWERVTDERYGSYYVDHINRRTQYENPVLQARRLRAEKLASENPGGPSNGSATTGELRGEKFAVTLTKGTQGLGFTMIGAEGSPETEGYLQIRSIVPHGPAWIDGGLRPGDLVVGVCGGGVRGLSQSQVAQMFQHIAPGTQVTLHLVRGYSLPFDTEDPNTRVLSTMAVDSGAPPDAVAMQQLTRALRTRFNLDSPNQEASPSRDETDNSPITHNDRRLLSRSFDLDENGTQEPTAVPPRSPSADNLLTASDSDRERSLSSGREFEVTLRRAAAGFGFTIADSVHGQKVKKVLDRSRCAGLREGDLLLQIGDTDVRHARHQYVVQVLKECPAMQETTLRIWRRNNNARAPRSRSATRIQPATTNPNLLGRSKTPTAEQLRSPSSTTLQDSLQDRLNGMNSEATYAVPEHKSNRESLQARRRRSSTPGGRLALPTGPAPPAPSDWPGQSQLGHQPYPDRWLDNSNNVRSWAENTQNWDQAGQKWDQGGQKWDQAGQKWDGAANGNGWEGGADRWNGNWSEVGTPTVHVDMNAAYWRGNNSVDTNSDNGGFPEDGLLHSPSTAAMAGRRRGDCVSAEAHLRSHSPSTASAHDRLGSPTVRLRSQSPSNHSSNSRIKGSPMRLRSTSPPRTYDVEPQRGQVYVTNYPQVEAGGNTDPQADVLVRLARGAAGFGFRIVGGTEDGSRVAVGHVVPGGPADGLLRPGDLLTSVDGVPLGGATHARAVAYVCQAAARGHVTLGVRHNRADIQPLGLPTMSPQHQHQPLLAYGVQYSGPHWSAVPYDVTVTRSDGEGFGFVVISSTNKATSTIGQLIANSPAARCGLLHVGDTILSINSTPIRNLPHPEVVALIKHSGTTVTLTVLPPDPRQE